MPTWCCYWLRIFIWNNNEKVPLIIPIMYAQMSARNHMSYLSWLTPPHSPSCFWPPWQLCRCGSSSDCCQLHSSAGSAPPPRGPTTGTVQSRVATVRLAVYVTAILNQRKKRTIKTCLSRREHKGCQMNCLATVRAALSLGSIHQTCFTTLITKTILLFCNADMCSGIK